MDTTYFNTPGGAGFNALLHETLVRINSSSLDEGKKHKYKTLVMQTVNTQNSYYNLLTVACVIQLDINKVEAPKELKNYQSTYIPIKDSQEATEDHIIDLSMPRLTKCDNRVGKWIFDHMDRICSVCKVRFDDEIRYICEDKLNYCPNCGAKMESEVIK